MACTCSVSIKTVLAAFLIVQERFIWAYLESALALQHCTGFVASERTEGAMEDAAAQLLQAANAYIPMSHLIWGLWGLLQVCLQRTRRTCVHALGRADDWR